MSSLLKSPELSRWCQRQLQAHPDWRAWLEEAARESASAAVLDALLVQERGGAAYQDRPHLESVLRKVRNRWLCLVMERDLEGRAGLGEVMAAMSLLADRLVQEALQFLATAQAARFGIPYNDAGSPVDLIVFGLGKLGGGELNVSSDIDLVFLYPGEGMTGAGTGRSGPPGGALSNAEFFERLGRSLIRTLSEVTGDGFVFRVDMRLRPHGDAGPLVASFAMLEDYLLTQGRDWERFAWLKARRISQPVFAGLEESAAWDASLAGLVTPFVYRRYLDFGAIAALRALHVQIRAEADRRDARHPERAHNVKLGRGGIREIEFIAQHYQIIRGGREPWLRDRATLATLAQLQSHGYLSAATGDALAAAYVLLRQVEHRLQYRDDAQTHAVPAAADERALLARLCAGATGCADWPALSDKLAETSRTVAAAFDALFADRADPAAAGSAGPDLLALIEDTGPEAAGRLEALLAERGFAHVAGARDRLAAFGRSGRVRRLTETTRARVAGLVDAALTLSVARASETTPAEVVLGRTLDLFDAIATRSAYLSLLAEFPVAFERVVDVLAASPWAARYLSTHPLLMDELLDTRTHERLDFRQCAQELERALALASGDVERQMDVLREIHHAAAFTLLIQDLEGRLTVEALSDDLSALADLLIDFALACCWAQVEPDPSLHHGFAVIAYGRLGGKELGYVSDLDLVFLCEDDPAPARMERFARLAQRLISWLTTRTPAGGLFEVDLRLRPDGAAGLLVSPFDAFARYQHESAWVWEHQALTRARACAGDPTLSERFERERRAILAVPRAVEALACEVVAMRAKMHAGHPNPSALFDLKHDPGGMVDIEFCVQFLVLAHAARFPELLDNAGNIALLRRAGARGLIDPALAETVAAAYRAYRRRQHELRLAEARFARVDPGEFAGERAAVRQMVEALGLSPKV